MMKYLRKTDRSEVITQGWRYENAGDRRRIRQALKQEQLGFCAYSERYIRETDAIDVEHFDPRLKETKRDSYWNWYTVLHWVNQHKPRHIEPFEPLLMPYSQSLPSRIKYEDRQFCPVDPVDREARNLIDYLKWNSPELSEDRRKHVKRIREIRNVYGDDYGSFLKHLVRNPENLSFMTALMSEFGLPSDLIDATTNS